MGQRHRRVSPRGGALAQRGAGRLPGVRRALGHPGRGGRHRAGDGLRGRADRCPLAAPGPARRGRTAERRRRSDRQRPGRGGALSHGHDRGGLRHGDDIRLRHRRRTLPRRRHHAGPPHRRRPAHPAHRQASRHRAARARAGDRPPDRGVHPIRRALRHGGGGGRPRPRVVATGGLASVVAPLTSTIDETDADLTLRGLRLAAGHLGLVW
jgi:hypothetical protein